MSELAATTSTTTSTDDAPIAMDATSTGSADPGEQPASRWWETPRSEYRAPVAVDPAIYGIDADETDDVTPTSGMSRMPFIRELQAAFGPRHDLGSLVAHTGDEATSTADTLGANAFASGSDIVFGKTPDLWTAAHEATHVVQQNAGIYPVDGIGTADDSHEQRADAVADTIVSGGSAQALLADYAPLKLDQGIAQAGPSSIVQFDRKDAPSAAPALSDASESSAFTFLAKGEDAAMHMNHGAEFADVLYGHIVDQASMKATHEQIDVAYKDATKQREKMLEVSTFEKIVGGVTALVDFATSLSGIISAARTLHAAASLRPISQRIAAREATRDDHLREHELSSKLAGKSKLKSVGDIAKGVDGVRKGVGKVVKAKQDPDAKVDADTILPNANAAAIKAANDAMLTWAQSDSKLNFVSLHQYGEKGALAFQQMVHGLKLLVNEGKPLSDESYARYGQLIAEFEAARDAYTARAQRVASLLKAYEAGGAAGIADPTERGVYEMIQQWKSTNDPKAKGLRFSLDQDAKVVHFHDWQIDIEAPLGGGTVTNYYCHLFRERTTRSEDATLFVNHGDAGADLMKKGLAPVTGGPVGDSEKQEDQPSSGLKLKISASIAKAIESLGVPGTANQAQVLFSTDVGSFGAVSNKQRGAWFDDWRSTDEFAAFWRAHLGGKYAFIMSQDGKRQTIPAAVGDAKVMERSVVSTPVQGGVL